MSGSGFYLSSKVMKVRNNNWLSGCVHADNM